MIMMARGDLNLIKRNSQIFSSRFAFNSEWTNYCNKPEGGT